MQISGHFCRSGRCTSVRIVPGTLAAGGGGPLSGDDDDESNPHYPVM